MRRDKFDTAFSTLIRARDHWTCQKCRTVFPEGRRGGLDSAHIITRGRHATRWLPMNALALCTGDHWAFGHNPVDFDKWIFKYLGEAKYTWLMDTKIIPAPKWTPGQKTRLYVEMKRELQLMKAAESGPGEWWGPRLEEAEKKADNPTLRARSVSGGGNRS